MRYFSCFHLLCNFNLVFSSFLMYRIFFLASCSGKIIFRIIHAKVFPVNKDYYYFCLNTTVTLSDPLYMSRKNLFRSNLQNSEVYWPHIESADYARETQNGCCTIRCIASSLGRNN